MQNSVQQQFRLKKPCENCPFRNDENGIPLMPGRRESIIEDLLTNAASTFHCHKTVDYSDETPKTNKACHCAGAAAVAQKFGRQTQAVQIASRLRIIPFEHYDEAMSVTIEPGDLNINRREANLV